ncbi:MAG: SdpI family protein [Bacteroidia bacterium]
MNHYLILSLAIGLSFFSFGVKLNRDPGSMDTRFAYRTRSSLRNEDTWYEANIYAGKVMMLIAAFVLPLLIFADIRINRIDMLISVFSVTILASLSLTYLFTEIHLRKLFFRDGKRRPKF